MLDKLAISNFDWTTLGSRGPGGGVVSLQLFWSLKNGPGVFVSFRIHPLPICPSRTIGSMR